MSSLDKFEIFALCNNYILSIDSHNNEQFADNFLDDGVYDNPWGVAKGRKEILEKISYWHASGITQRQAPLHRSCPCHWIDGPFCQSGVQLLGCRGRNIARNCGHRLLPWHGQEGEWTMENCFSKASDRPKLQNSIINTKQRAKQKRIKMLEQLSSSSVHNQTLQHKNTCTH